MQQGFFHRLLKHKTAANLFLLLMVILGFYASKVLNTQFFPNYSIDYISINVELKYTLNVANHLGHFRTHFRMLFNFKYLTLKNNF